MRFASIDALVSTERTCVWTLGGVLSDEQVERLLKEAGTALKPFVTGGTVGFGMPALEALSCGVPTLVSDRGALPEVVGDAALVVDGGSVKAIANGLVRLLTDEPLRQELRRRGPKRAAAFGWDAAAEETLSVLREAASGRR